MAEERREIEVNSQRLAAKLRRAMTGVLVDLIDP